MPTRWGENSGILTPTSGRALPSSIYTIFEGTSEIQRPMVARANSGAHVRSEQREVGSPRVSDSLKIVTLCTGNVARSVMLGYMITTLAEAYGEDWSVRSAGTHVSEGSAMSSRTREALMRIDELGEHHYGAHRSRQLADEDAAWADVIIATEADHVSFVRRSFAEHAAKTVQLHQFVRFAPLDATFEEQLAQVSAMEPESRFDVADPAGGDQSVYDACARQLWELAQAFALLVSDEPD